MSLQLFDPEMDDVHRLMQDEEKYDVFVENISKSRFEEPNPGILATYRLPADPMSYLNLDSEASSLKQISSDESDEEYEEVGDK